MTLRRNTTTACSALLFTAMVRPCIAATGTGSLVDAIRWNDVATVRQVSSTEAVRPLDETGTTPLMYAAVCGTPDVIRVLIRHGASVNVANRSGATALMWAATSRTENVKALLALGADVNARTTNGRTALLTAARYGNANAMRALLGAGADTSASETRRHLLTASFYSTNPAVRNVLREAGIVPSSTGDLTGSVLDWTRRDHADVGQPVDAGRQSE